jgi:hypothetical protein
MRVASSGRQYENVRASVWVPEALFLPAISKDALKKISRRVLSWRRHLRTGHTFADLARKINPIVRGWMHYYGAFYPSALYRLLARINTYLVRWIRKKYSPAAGAQDSPSGLAASCSRISLTVRALEVGQHDSRWLTIRMTRAVSPETVAYGSVGAGRWDPSRPPDQAHRPSREFGTVHARRTAQRVPTRRIKPQLTTGGCVFDQDRHRVTRYECVVSSVPRLNELRMR